VVILELIRAKNLDLTEETHFIRPRPIGASAPFVMVTLDN
jgi:hypothetical protein